MEETFCTFFCNQVDWLDSWVLNHFRLVIQEWNQLNQWSINELLFSFLISSNQEGSKRPDWGLTILGICVIDSIWGKVQDQFLKLLGILFKDSLKTLGSSVIHSIFLIVFLIAFNGAQCLKEPSDHFSTNLPTNVVPDTGIDLRSEFVFWSKLLPKLNCLNAIILVFVVLDNGLE